jgi:hypothetical protein
MSSSGMLRRMALVRTDISEELSALIIRVTRKGDTLIMEAQNFSETAVLTRVTRRNISRHYSLENSTR